MTLLYGLITGFIVGFIMQKSRVIRYDAQVGALRLIDLTIVKFMLSAVISGSILLYLLTDLGLVELNVKATAIGANVIGGVVFGAGWALVGYCPGTSVAALGEGRWDALFGIIGMLFGAGLFAAVYPAFKDTVMSWGDFGKVTLADALHINHWVIIVALVIGSIFLFRFFENREL